MPLSSTIDKQSAIRALTDVSLLPSSFIAPPQLNSPIANAEKTSWLSLATPSIIARTLSVTTGTTFKATPLPAPWLKGSSRHPQDKVRSLLVLLAHRDPATAEHCERVAAYALALGQYLGLSPHEQTSLIIGAALHDVGKLFMPHAILFKPGALTDAERAVIEWHPLIGTLLCAPLSMASDAVDIVLHHHERVDGTGYPHRLSHPHIRLVTRITSVVDAFDAMTTNRPYRQAMAIRQAIKILHAGAGSQWDKEMVSSFLHMMGQKGLASLWQEARQLDWLHDHLTKILPADWELLTYR